MRFSSFPIFNTNVPEGHYIFYYALDDNADGVPDATWVDTVGVQVRSE